MDCMEKINLVKSIGKKQRIIAVVAFVYWLAGFFFEKLIFTPGAAGQNVMNYCLVKLLSLLSIYALLLFFVNAVGGWKNKSAESETLKYLLPLFVPVTAFWAVSNAWPLGYGDQYNILMATLGYETMAGFFNYMTMYVYMVALNIIPVAGFAVVFKIFLVSMAVGYCIFRFRKIYPSWICFLLYAPFIIPPGFYLCYNIHRCPMYAPLYMFFSCLLLCDHLEGKSLGKWKFVLLAVLSAVLTQWRSEGIYLVIFAPVLLYLCYKPDLSRKTAALSIAVMMAVQLLVFIPQSVESSKLNNENGGRTMPLFEYLITNMERKGLDKEKNAADLALVDKHISVEEIHKLNEADGDFNYGDNRIIYHGKRHGATREEIEDFKSAVIRIVIKNPLVYIRTQLGAWSYISTANYYERKLDYISNIFTDLYVPTAWLLALWIYLLAKKKWFPWFMTSCHLCHMVITTALLPAAYFKYYYSEYLYAVLTLVLVLILLMKKRQAKKI